MAKSSQLTPERAAALARRPQVAQDYIRGETQADIAKKCGVDQSQISRDLKAIQKEWLKATAFNLDRLKAKELAKLDEIERSAWEGWQKSLKDAERQKISTTGEAEGGKIEKIKEGQSGNPRFLEVVLRCIEKRSALLGLDAPKRTELTGPDGAAIPISYIEPVNPYEQPTAVEPSSADNAREASPPTFGSAAERPSETELPQGPVEGVE